MMAFLYFLAGIFGSLLAFTLRGTIGTDLAFAGFLLGLITFQLVKIIFVKPWALLALVRLVIFFLYDLIVSTLRLSQDVLAIHPSFKPAIIALDTRPLSDLQGVWLAVLLSIIPGTLAVSFSQERHELYIYSLYGGDVDKAKASMYKHAHNLQRVMG